MTNQNITSSSRRHAPRARVIALLLFVLVSYGATVEVVHKHGNFSKSYDETNSSVRTTNDEGAATKNSTQSGACLICQLHQNLFVSLFNAQPRIVPPAAQAAFTATQPSSYLSQLDTPRRGRAPPLASLL